ncbi:MAG: CDP-alcohol phosphatidyltransferase family protein [Verrucomicrobia bacterium]|nr:CDP-alcohol phosphatidyltransferase family protein [Verrucomicrobiota bacterium]
MQKGYQPGERRPIAARNLKLSQSLARWLARQGASPNAISVTGMTCGILAGFVLAATSFASGNARWCWISGAVLIQLRLLANLLDGMVAIESQRASPLGELYNEIPDRLSDAATLIGLGYSTGGSSTLGYAAAAAAVLTAYVRAQGKVAGARQHFCGPMAKQQRMFVVTLIGVYCAVAPLAWQPVWGDETGWGIPAAGLALIVVGSVITAIRRLIRVADDLRHGAK